MLFGIIGGVGVSDSVSVLDFEMFGFGWLFICMYIVLWIWIGMVSFDVLFVYLLVLLFEVSSVRLLYVFV